jgi:serine phosphatase RsbU (regulator of sigma subunit)
MLEQPREHRMVTFAVVEIDVGKGTAVVTNAAHPPLFVTGQGVREVLLPALPIGFTWPHPPPSSTLELVPGARLIFYSDGLVEALDPSDEQFGYQRLQHLLSDNLELATEELLNKLLSELSLHTSGRPLDDDLTILIIDCDDRGA